MVKPAHHFLIFTSLLFMGTFQAAVLQTDDSSYYTAGVVEFRPAQYSHPQWSSQRQLADNLQAYIDIIVSKEAVETDIIVFPEMSLNNNDGASFVPDPERVAVAPCDAEMSGTSEEYHDFLIQLSCQARNASKYIVVNIVEKAFCEPPNIDPRPCANSGFNLFNTNVVFDRTGVVVSRYRKVHLWGEPRNVTFVPSFGFFETDFGVRFGHFVCFDLMFYMPAQEMVEKHGIQDFVFPTMWFSQLPFLTAVQIQSAWSFANDVNFLAAGASFPAVGTTGTGIYAGRRGALKAVMSQNLGERKLYVARLEKRIAKESRVKREDITKKEEVVPDQSVIILKSDYLENYETEALDLSDGQNLEKQLCDRNPEQRTKFCCRFELNWHEVLNENVLLESENRKSSRYSYRLGVFNGLRKEAAPESNQLRNCAIFACTGDDISECGQVFNKQAAIDIVFDHLAIEASFPNATEVLLMPNSLKEDLLPVSVEDFSWKETDQGSSTKIRFELTKPVKNLLTFAIYGNYYDSKNVADEQFTCEDETEGNSSVHCEDGRGDDGASSIVISLILLIGCGIMSVLS